MHSNRYRVGRLETALFWLLTLVLLFPLLRTLAMGFWFDGPSLDHVRSVLGNGARTLKLCRNSAVLAMLTLLVCLPPAVCSGYLLFRSKLPGRNIVIVLLVLAATIPLYVTTAAWTSLIGNSVWYSMDDWWQKAIVAAWVQGTAWYPIATLLCGVSFARADHTLEDQARLETGQLGVFLRVSLPQAAWGIAGVALLLAILALSDITITDTVRLTTFQQECYVQFQQPNVRNPGEAFVYVKPRRATAAALPLLLAMATGLCFVGRHLRGWGEHSHHAGHTQPTTATLGPMTQPAAILLLAVGTALLAFPLIQLFRIVGAWQSLAKTWKAAGPEISNSIGLASLAGLLCVVAAFFWCRQMRHRHHGLGLLLAVLLAMPAPVVGISLITHLNNDLLAWLYDSRYVYVYAWFLRFLPFAVLAMLPSVKQIPSEMHEEAVIMGAHSWQHILFVELPMCWRGILSAWLLTFILSIGELGASFLVQAPGQNTLTIRFFTLIHSGVYSSVAGICLIVIFAVMLPAALLCMLLWKILHKAT